VVICSDNPTFEQVENVQFLPRPPSLSSKNTTGEQIAKYVAKKIGNYNVIVYLEITHLYRPKNMIDDMIKRFTTEKLDTLFTAQETTSVYWKYDTDRYKRMDETFMRSMFRRPIYKEMMGLVTITSFKAGKFVGDNVGIVPIKGVFSTIDIKSEEDIWLANSVFYELGYPEKYPR